MRHIRTVTALALLLTACSANPSTAPRPGSGPRPTDYNITQLVALKHVKAENVIAKFEEMGVPEGMVIHQSPTENSVLLVGQHQLVRQALKVVATMDKP